MVKVDIKTPDLLDIALLIGFFLNLILGYILVFKSLQLPIILETTAATTLTAIFTWLTVLWISVVALLIEYNRKEIKELKEKIK